MSEIGQPKFQFAKIFTLNHLFLAIHRYLNSQDRRQPYRPYFANFDTGQTCWPFHIFFLWVITLNIIQPCLSLLSAMIGAAKAEMIEPENCCTTQYGLSNISVGLCDCSAILRLQLWVSVWNTFVCKMANFDGKLHSFGILDLFRCGFQTFTVSFVNTPASE